MRNEKSDSTSEGSGRNLREPETGASTITAKRESSYPKARNLMEAVVERENMTAAYERVVKNKGAAGVDGIPVSELKAYLQIHWGTSRKNCWQGNTSPTR